MIQAKHAFHMIALAVALVTVGCESVSLLPRADIDERDRGGTSGANIGRTDRYADVIRMSERRSQTY